MEFVNVIVAVLMLFGERGTFANEIYKRDCCLTGSFQMKDGIRSMGATWMPQYNDTASCLDACINSFDNCFAVDVDSRSRLGKFCWVHSNVTALNVVYRAHDIKQYTVKAVCKQPVCGQDGVIWRLYSNQNSFDGNELPPSHNGSWSVADCLSACASNAACLAVDYDTVTSRCYQFTDPNFASSRGSYPNVNQFVADRCSPGISVSQPTWTTWTAEITRKLATRTIRPNIRPTPVVTPATTSVTPQITTKTNAVSTLPVTSRDTTRTTPESTHAITPRNTTEETTQSSRAPVEWTTQSSTKPKSTAASGPLTTASISTESSPPERTTSVSTTRGQEPSLFGCRTRWISLTNVHSPGGVQYLPADEEMTIEACLAHCETLSGNAAGFDACLAVDIDKSTNPVGCWIHTSIILLSSKYYYEGVTQHNIVRCPQDQNGSYVCVPDSHLATKIQSTPVVTYLNSCAKICSPAWMSQPSNTNNTIYTTSCMEKCLKTEGCVAVDMSESNTECIIYKHRYPAAADEIAPGVRRYRLLDRCYTECDVIWTAHNATVYHLTDAQTLPNIIDPEACGALCRRNPNCAVYQLTALPDNTLACTVASSYSPQTSSIDARVITYARDETSCQVNEYNCETSWLLHRNTRVRLSRGDQSDRSRIRIVSTVGECLDACLMSSSGPCQAVVIRPVSRYSSSLLWCRRHGVSINTNMFVHSSISDLFVMQSQCYRTGCPSQTLKQCIILLVFGPL